MSFAFKTQKSIIVDNSSFFIGTTGFNTTTTPSNETKITASDGATSDEFGSSVAVGSGKIVVGAWRDDDNGTSSGSAYIYDLDGSNEVKITASNGDIGDNFGNSVAAGSGRIVVGAPNNDILTNTNNYNNQGAAYLFDLDGNQLGIMTASDGTLQDNFGDSVAVGCGRIVVSAEGDDDNGSASGSAYIFDLDGNQLTKITASDGAASDLFGRSVAAGSGRIVVGARGDDDNGSSSGSAYIFDLDGNQLAKITASDAASGDFFGQSVAAGSGRIVVGAPRHDVGINTGQGAAYIYDLSGTQLAKITASDGAAFDEFGNSVAVGSGRIVVGANQDDVGANADQGSAYIFDLNGNQLGIITASDGAADDEFGGGSSSLGLEVIGVGCGRIVVGAPNKDVGTNAAQGAAYIYETPYQIHYLDQLDGR